MYKELSKLQSHKSSLEPVSLSSIIKNSYVTSN